MMKQFIEILRNNPDHAYDFIANNAWNFSKDELRNIIKEFLYAINRDLSALEYEEITTCVAEELNDMYSEN